MRIAIFHELPVKSGSRIAVNEIAKQLGKKHTVDLYVIDDQKKTEENFFYHKIFFYPFHPVPWTGKNWKARLYRDTIELLKLYYLNKKIAKHIQEEKYDIVFIHGSKFIESPFILRFSLKNKVYYAHAPNYAISAEKHVKVQTDFFRKTYEKINRMIRKKIDKKNMQCTDLILANSAYTKKQIEKIYKRNSTVCYLGVDTKVFKNIHTVKKYDLLFIGSYQPMDGYSYLQKALTYMKHQPRARILLYEKEWIKSTKELVKLYNSAKIVVCLAFDEPFGLVAIEAMACGVPVIAVNEAGYKETVKSNQTGYLIKRDARLLAKKITELLENNDKRKTFSQKARDHIESNFSWDIVMENIEEVFRKYSV